MTEEVWKPIPGYDEYEASDAGRIRRIDLSVTQKHRAGCDYTRILPGKIIEPLQPLRDDGYNRVTLAVNQDTRRRAIKRADRLVCAAFYGDQPAGADVKHCDGDRSNDAADNLVWDLTAAAVPYRLNVPADTNLTVYRRIAPDDLAWCAGLFEGEGCIRSDGEHLSATVSSTDPDVLEALKERSGLGKINGPYPGKQQGHKPYGVWSVHGSAARHFLFSVRPWLGERRTSCLDAGVDRYENRPRRRKVARPKDWYEILRLAAEGCTYDQIATWLGIGGGYSQVGQVVRQAIDEGFTPATYIAGPMTGYAECNYPAFEDATNKLRQAGFSVISPHELHPIDHTRSWDWFMRRDLRELVKCVRVIMLHGWEFSKGARLEHRVAQEIGLEIVYWNELEEWVNGRN